MIVCIGKRCSFDIAAYACAIRQSPVALLISLNHNRFVVSQNDSAEKEKREVVDYCTYHSLRIFENKCDEENEFLSRKVF